MSDRPLMISVNSEDEIDWSSDDDGPGPVDPSPPKDSELYIQESEYRAILNENEALRDKVERLEREKAELEKRELGHLAMVREYERRLGIRNDSPEDAEPI